MDAHEFLRKGVLHRVVYKPKRGWKLQYFDAIWITVCSVPVQVVEELFVLASALRSQNEHIRTIK